jgi:hypothetical protein
VVYRQSPSPPPPRSPPLTLGPALDRRRLPYRADAVDPFRLGELPFVEHLIGSLMADAEVGADVLDAKGAASVHPPHSPHPGSGPVRVPALS